MLFKYYTQKFSVEYFLVTIQELISDANVKHMWAKKQ